MELRYYQRDALAACWDFLRNREGNPALVLPTGAGKSPLMAALAMDAVQQWGGRVGVIAHVKELVQQNSAKLRALWPHAPMGVYAAGLRSRDRFDKILYMQIQSIADKAHKLGKFDLLIIDEAHRIPLKSDGRYRQFLDECRRFNPALRVVGLTATPYRLQGKAVPVCGENYILNEIAYEARVTDLIRDGFLSKLVTPGGLEMADLSKVRVKGDDYEENSLAEAMMANELVERTCADICARAAHRRAWIVFCANVKHAETARDELIKRGITSAVVSGETPAGERAKLIEDFRRGFIRAMVNVNVLSEGFDAPHIDCVAMLRPTKSPGLMYQQIGRGFRLAPGKEDCLVLDFAGNLLEHGPVDQIRVTKAKPRKASAVQTGKMKECPKCKSLLPIGVRICDSCKFQFTSGAPQHSDRPVDAPILSTDRVRKISTHAVTNVLYSKHDKPGKPISLRVTYMCGMRRFAEWVCVEHSGMPRTKAVSWWQRRAGEVVVPHAVDEALELTGALLRPLSITVDETDKYPEIIGHEFAEPSAESARPDSGSKCGEDVGTPARPDTVRRMSNVPAWLVSALENDSTGKRAA